MFQFAPVYVSAESMRWWLGRECFAKQKCILATREERNQEDREDEMEDYYKHVSEHPERSTSPTRKRRRSSVGQKLGRARQKKGTTAWYDEHVPPFALWVAGSDDLVDGRRLLRRFERGREPHVRVVHEKIIEEYEHLDVIWAMDVIEQVGQEVKEVLWKTCDVRDRVRVPLGCEDIQAWEDPKTQKLAVNGHATDEKRRKDAHRDGEEDDGESQSDSSDNEEIDDSLRKNRLHLHHTNSKE
jgi:hypothetical protein